MISIYYIINLPSDYSTLYNTYSISLANMDKFNIDDYEKMLAEMDDE